MEILNLLAGRWLEVAAAVYLIGMILYGHHRGFLKLAVSAAALFLSLFAVRFAQPYVTDWLKTSTPVYEAVVSGIESASGLDAIMSDGLGGFSNGESAGDAAQGAQTWGSAGAGNQLETARERTMIEALSLPEQLKRSLIENNNAEIYELLGVNLFREYVSGYLADLLIRTAVFVILFLVLFIGLRVLAVWLDLIAHLPILSGINQIAGAILGGVEALIFLWVIGLILTLLSGTALGRSLLSQVEASVWLSFLYNHNFLSVLVVGLIQTVL